MSAKTNGCLKTYSRLYDALIATISYCDNLCGKLFSVWGSCKILGTQRL